MVKVSSRLRRSPQPYSYRNIGCVTDDWRPRARRSLLSLDSFSRFAVKRTILKKQLGEVRSISVPCAPRRISLLSQAANLAAKAVRWRALFIAGIKKYLLKPAIPAEIPDTRDLSAETGSHETACTTIQSARFWRGSTPSPNSAVISVGYEARSPIYPWRRDALWRRDIGFFAQPSPLGQFDTQVLAKRWSVHRR